MNNYSFRLLFVLVILQAFTVRFWHLDIIPYTNPAIHFSRILSAISGSLTVPVFVYLFYKYFKIRKLSLIAGWWLSIIPWHVEQSRISSIYPIFLIIFLGLTLLISSSFSKLKPIFALGLFIIAVLVLKPFWFQYQSFSAIPSGYIILNNFFRQLSFDFLFFRNESFWSGGLRSFGAMLPESIPVFLLGFYLFFKKTCLVSLSLTLILGLTIISAVNPKFPETRELFLGIPVLIIILALGTDNVFNRLSHNLVKKIFAVIYFLILIYGLLQFFHYYFIHYTARVVNEKSYEINRF